MPKAPEEVIFDPETVTPEMGRLPPELMEKTLKLPLLALMVSNVEPGPVTESVPAVVAVTMAGKDDASVMVPVIPKLMVSSPAEALASIIACRRVPAPASALEETVMVAGVILS